MATFQNIQFMDTEIWISNNLHMSWIVLFSQPLKECLKTILSLCIVQKWLAGFDLAYPCSERWVAAVPHSLIDGKCFLMCSPPQTLSFLHWQWPTNQLSHTRNANQDRYVIYLSTLSWANGAQVHVGRWLIENIRLRFFYFYFF